MRLVRIHLLRQLRIGAEAFFIFFRHETVRSFMVVIVTVVQWRLVAKFHRLEDKIVVVELERSTANRDKRCHAVLWRAFGWKEKIKSNVLVHFTCWNRNARAAYLLIFPLLRSHLDESDAKQQQSGNDRTKRCYWSALVKLTWTRINGRVTPPLGAFPELYKCSFLRIRFWRPTYFSHTHIRRKRNNVRIFYDKIETEDQAVVSITCSSSSWEYSVFFSILLLSESRSACKDYKLKFSKIILNEFWSKHR